MLTDILVRNAKPSAKTFKMYDSAGLYLEISPSGGKWWRFKYRYLKKEKRLSLGVYPEITLKRARERRDEMRRLLAEGIDPSNNRKAIKADQNNRIANSFELVAREWFEKNQESWVPNHATRIMRRLERDIFPWLGERPIADIDAQEILICLRRIEGRGAIETAHRLLRNIGQVMRYGVVTGRVFQNPTPDLRGALSPIHEKHFAAVIEPKQVCELLRAINGYKGTFAVQCALKFAPLVFVRPGEMRKAEWKDFDLDQAEWRYEITKTKTQHVVPLSKQAVEILSDLKPLTGMSKYVFPSLRSFERPMSDNAILSALRRVGIPKEEMSGHGFRAMARTILDEVLGFRPDLIEHQLAHAVRDPNGRAYNRTAHLPQRKEMMQAWADYLDNLKAGGEILPLKRSAN
jgi:integrase